MKKVTLYEFQMTEILDALRQTDNINGCYKKETAYHKKVMRAKQFAENSLKGEPDKKVER